MIVLDTNVASELMKVAPSIEVARWLESVDDQPVYTTAVTVAEVRYGIERLPEGARRDQLRSGAIQVFGQFEGMVLPFDEEAANLYADVVCRRERAGLPIADMDAQIAAICRANRATLATRNTKDFAGTGIDVVDPWSPI